MPKKTANLDLDRKRRVSRLEERSADENPAAFKHLFGLPLLKRLSAAIEHVWPEFDRRRFHQISDQLRELEMKGRVRCIREQLKLQLPAAYPPALDILMRAATFQKNEAKPAELNGFDLWPFSDFIQNYGLGHLEISLVALAQLTPLFTSEFAVRPFLNRFPEPTLKFLLSCTASEDTHLRRWASEGSRPRLPWGERLQAFVLDPEHTRPILEALKFDPELYVRKSVSNHLNDVAKDHPEWVIAILKRWKKLAQASGASEAHIQWIIQHALRTLIKKGDLGALALIGVSPQPKIALNGFVLSQRNFKLGGRLEFQFALKSLSSKSQKLVIDYVIHFVRANQTRTPKVFKLKSFNLEGASSTTVAKAHHLKPVTTRVHYPGEHLLEIQINGRVLARSTFILR